MYSGVKSIEVVVGMGVSQAMDVRQDKERSGSIGSVVGEQHVSVGFC